MEGILERIRAGELPDHAKGAIVQGLMPLDPEILIEASYWICRELPELLETARETFSNMPDGAKIGFFKNPELEPELIEFYLSGFPVSKEIKSAAILNPATPGTAIEAIAPDLEAELIDLAVNNQVKIQETPSIIQALEKNPQLSINQKQKLEEYGRLLLKPVVSPAEELAHKSLEEVEAEAIADAMAYVKVFGKEKERKKTPKAAKPKPAESEQDQEELKSMSIIEGIANMTIPQKIQLAIKGDREARGILIRDANKLVSCAVIRSPRITESEAEFYSNLRNVQTDVLRLIATNREWIKSYKIAMNLIKNPRTPIAFTMKLLPRLNKKDLKFLQRDKGIPEALRTMARRLARTEVK